MRIVCGRYFIADDREELEIKKIIDDIENRYKGSDALSRMKTGEIYPTDTVPVLTQESPTLMKWGFTKFDGKGHLINARMETADEKPTFKKSYLEKRCLIPASYFFEWKNRDGKKEKYAIGTDKTIYMAGLYRMEKEFDTPVFVILTMPASKSISFIHDRMPVIIPENIKDQWLKTPMNNKKIMEVSTKDLMYRNA
ncbi:SOS response-associated peptidase [Alkalibacter mobilis]|uniref:SOS response-associated peptidase n=1 Tax=Alkalibacter mobilis TaxID=2787712 RepID=UPI00189E2D3C|nr:SOS response-associated peptidase [Alkalibacter mobilis]MBF7097439.1 SOS response-associated peptidase [Alkalibacter mobilis]